MQAQREAEQVKKAAREDEAKKKAAAALQQAQLEAEQSKRAVQELEAILEDAKLYEDASDTFSLSCASEASSLLSEEEEGVFTALTSMLLFQNEHMLEMIQSLRIFPIAKLFN